MQRTTRQRTTQRNKTAPSNERTDGRTNKRTNEPANEPANRRTKERTDAKQTKERRNERNNEPKNPKSEIRKSGRSRRVDTKGMLVFAPRRPRTTWSKSVLVLIVRPTTTSFSLLNHSLLLLVNTVLKGTAVRYISELRNWRFWIVVVDSNEGV